MDDFLGKFRETEFGLQVFSKDAFQKLFLKLHTLPSLEHAVTHGLFLRGSTIETTLTEELQHTSYKFRQLDALLEKELGPDLLKVDAAVLDRFGDLPFGDLLTHFTGYAMENGEFVRKEVQGPNEKVHLILEQVARDCSTANANLLLPFEEPATLEPKTVMRQVCRYLAFVTALSKSKACDEMLVHRPELFQKIADFLHLFLRFTIFAERHSREKKVGPPITSDHLKVLFVAVAILDQGLLRQRGLVRKTLSEDPDPGTAKLAAMSLRELHSAEKPRLPGLQLSLVEFTPGHAASYVKPLITLLERILLKFDEDFL